MRRTSSKLVSVGGAGLAFGVLAALIKAVSERQVAVLFLDQILSGAWLDDPAAGGVFVFAIVIYLSAAILAVGLVMRALKA